MAMRKAKTISYQTILLLLSYLTCGRGQPCEQSQTANVNCWVKEAVISYLCLLEHAWWNPSALRRIGQLQFIYWWVFICDVAFLYCPRRNAVYLSHLLCVSVFFNLKNFYQTHYFVYDLWRSDPIAVRRLSFENIWNSARRIVIGWTSSLRGDVAFTALMSTLRTCLECKAIREGVKVPEVN